MKKQRPDSNARRERKEIAEHTCALVEAALFEQDSELLDQASRSLLIPDFASQISQAIKETQIVEWKDCVFPKSLPKNQTKIEVTTESTLEAAHRLVGLGCNPVALNFASARNPGGGFLSGASAQEESIARASALYYCLDTQKKFYTLNQRASAFYLDMAIYSPLVPVFKDDQGKLITPYLCSFISAPAPNANSIRKKDEKKNTKDEILRSMKKRIHLVLSTALRFGHKSIILGAFGCGVFGNDPNVVAGFFKEALENEFKNCFSLVTFALHHDERGVVMAELFRKILGIKSS